MPEREAPASRWRMLGSAVSFGVAPLLLLLGMVDSRRMPNGHFGPWTLFLIVGGVAVAVGVPLALKAGALARTSRAGRWLVAAFTLLIAWGVVSGLTHVQVAYERLGSRGSVVVDHAYVVVPMLSALIACLLGWVVAHAVERRLLPALLACVGWAVLAVVVVALLRMVASGSWGQRLNTPLAGAASVHVALLLGAAGFLGLAASGRARAVNATAACATLLGLFLTASRAGVASAGVLLLVLLLRWRPRRHAVAFRLALGGVAAAAVVGVAVLHPEFSRLLSLTDEYRARNTATGLAAVSRDLATLLFGTGEGTVWPWMAYESALVRLEPDWDLWTPFGPVLPNPHSTYLWALVELGIVGLALLLAALWPVLRGGLRRGLPPLVAPMAMALLLSLVSFATDTHLVKNFPVALVWWFGAFVMLRIIAEDDGTGAETPVEERKRS
ncbi:O-antigen ligase family protein [[Pseudopropionibacterium] massiliense]|uniref:O-antigen ligase family protein n=1 Tax=[Pseudopropionibacterium] massiliense TaxID=2220000 RepID=UPI0013EEEFC6|nr:O-antigen ligase family protein [[Pseudopropionibacterium] massiliense]